MSKVIHAESVSLLQLGAGLVGRFLGPLLAVIPKVGRARVVDRGVYTEAKAKTQAWHSASAGQPKAHVVAEMMRAANCQLEAESIVADIENLPLGLFRCDILLTALDSKRARMVANYAFRKLAIPYWIDSGVSAPWLVRVSTFAQGQNSPCYECALDSADYASEQSYPCQPGFTPPPTNSPAYLGSLAASLQAAECARLLSDQLDQASLNRELVYDVSSRRLFVTRLELRDCRLDHSAFPIRPLRRSPQRITVAEVFALRGNGSTTKSGTGTFLEVPGKLFVRELACPCGARRSTLRLKGRFGTAGQACARCGGRMSPAGTGLTNVLARRSLSPRELARPLSALGLQSADVIAIGARCRVVFYELGYS
jgi:molybdopterin/thiamine biosynthesis adenylyltransferase